MTTETYLTAWRDTGLISVDQHATLVALVRKERFSVFLELNALLYVGVLAIAAGLGWTVHDHFASFGDLLVLGTLSAIFVGCLAYCLTHDAARSFAFDYVLYLGCLTFAVAVGYVEFRFSLLKQNWDGYLLASALLYFALAYRFDNRFVLALALSTLAGWFGIRLAMWQVLSGSVRGLMLVYGALVGAAGFAVYRANIKPHFLDAYLHVAANALLGALASGAVDWRDGGPWALALAAAAAVSIVLGTRHRRFVFVVYGFVYGYVGVSAQMIRALNDASAITAYFVVSGLAVVAALIALARRKAAA